MSETFSVSVTGDDVVVRLIPILDMAIAEELLNTLRDGAAMMKNLVLDGEEVERLSTPCIQVILAAAKDVEDKGKVFRICKVSDGFQRGMRDLGLVEQLNNWSES